MSLVKSPEMTEENRAAHQANGRNSQGPVTPQGKANSAAANLRHGFYTTERAEVLAALGENPEDYLCLMESLVEDLQPRAGLESHMVTQMGETLWRMERARRMQEGLALRRIQSNVFGEEMMAVNHASRAIENLEPFERLQAVLARRNNGPTPEEIQAFVDSREPDPSPEMQEFIALLESLNQPLEDLPRKTALRNARSQLRRLMEGHQTAAWCLARKANKVQSPSNLAALAAPKEENAVLLQRMEESNLRRLCRLTNTLMRIRQGRLALKKDVKNEGRSGDMYENKEQGDTMPDEKTDRSA